MEKFKELYQKASKDVIDELRDTLGRVDVAALEKLANDMLTAEKVFFIGVGRVAMSLQGICKRFSHLGVDTHFVGDVCEPAITDKDLLIVGSGRGMSLFPVAIARKAKQFNAKVVHIGSNPHGDMEPIADYMVRIPVRTRLYLEDEIESCQPMTSLFEQSLLLVGDILAKIIIEKRGMDLKGLWQYHANLE